MQTIEPALSLAHYRRLAARYDRCTRRMEPVRARALARLCVRAGDTVLDVACGTGKSFAALCERVGPHGRVIGIDHSPDMLALARARVRAAGWRNVELIEAPAERIGLAGAADAMLLCYAHDVLQSPAALARLALAARPGARVALAGMKYFPWWLAPLNLLVLAKARGYLSDRRGLRAPWRGLACRLDHLRVESMYAGIAYVAHGAFPG